MPLVTEIHRQDLIPSYMNYVYGTDVNGNQLFVNHNGQVVPAGTPGSVPFDSIVGRAYYLRNQPYAAFQGRRQEPYTRQMEEAERLANQRRIAQPYIDRASSQLERSTQPFYQNARQYMNPYQKQVVGKIREEGMRTLKENILPMLESQFIKSGQFRSSKHRDMAQRAARDITNEILGRQSHALHAGYGQAGHLYGQDMARLQAAAHQNLGLGTLSNAQHAQDIETLRTLGGARQSHGQQSRDIAYQDFLRQQAYPWQQLQLQSGIMQGVHVPITGTEFQQTPPAPQLNTAGNIGALGTNILSAMLAGRR